MSSLKRFIFIDVFFIVVCGLLAFLFFNNLIPPNKTNTPRQKEKEPVVAVSSVPHGAYAKAWQIELLFNTQKQQLQLANVAIKFGVANPSPDYTSPYQLFILDKNKKILLKTDIVIAQEILYNLYFPSGVMPTSLPSLDSFSSIVAIPYFENAQTIEIRKNTQKVLVFSPPKEQSFAIPSLVQQTYATACSQLHIVFVSDGYNDMAKFHVDVQKAEATFVSKAPFSSHPNMFDFKLIDNPISNPLGCKKNNELYIYCLFNKSITKITDLVAAVYPQLPLDTTYTKIVVLVDGVPQQLMENGKETGYVTGVANAIGGQFGVFQNQQFFESTATMEVLGHDVGQLYDRYLYPESASGQVTAADFGSSKLSLPFSSNCTTNPQGELFWKSAGITQSYKGCTSPYLYAPAPLDCPNGQGSSKTIMSAAGCAGSQFDAVEQYYLTSVIIPKYLCASSPTPMPTPITTSVVSPKSSSVGTLDVVPQTVSENGFDCQPDPGCKPRASLQLCALICKPK